MSTELSSSNGRTAPLPTFLIIGAQKSGTRWLRRNLGQHRSVFTADEELEFFNHHHGDGLDGYREQFRGGAAARAVGEATPGYMFHGDGPAVIAERIEQALGSDVALIALLRDPVERTRSSYVHHLRRERIDPDVHPLDYLAALDPQDDPLGIISGGWYGASLEPFAQRFGRLLIEFHEHIATDGEGLYLRALEHIGVDDPWVPADIHDVVFSGTGPVAKRFPGHPILSLPYEDLAELVGPSFLADAAVLTTLVQTTVPWSQRLESCATQVTA